MVVQVYTTILASMWQGNNIQPCNSKQLITREDFDEEIEKSTNEGNSLKFTITLLEGLFRSKLGKYDLFYVEDKYVDLQINFLLEKVPQQITKTIDVNTLLAFINKLEALYSLDQCCDFVNEFYSRENKNKQLLALKQLCATSKKVKSHEKQYVKEFIRQCFALVHLKADYVSGEIDFNYCLTELFKFNKSPAELCERLELLPEIVKNLENGSCFKDFLNKLYSTTFNNNHEYRLQQSAKLIINQDNFLLIKDIKITIESYLKKPILSEVYDDGRLCLEVSGKHIVISKVLEGIVEKLENSRLIEEVRFVNAGVIHIDVNISSSIWQGKNLVVYAETVIINDDKKVTLDVSGKDAVDPIESIEAGFDENGCGKSGFDGQHGESGGNVLFIVGELINAHNFIIKSNGGCGGRGQDGGKGMNGRDGVFLEEKSFKELFPPASKFFQSNKSKNLEFTKESLLMTFESVESFFYGGFFFSMSIPLSKTDFEKYLSKILNNLENVYCELRTNTGCKITFSFYYGNLIKGCQSLLLHEGSLGGEGKSGGRGGQGGKGGHEGEIIIQAENREHLDVSLSRARGNEGKPGMDGMDGNPGKKGIDRGYTDYSRDLFGKWPKYFIPGLNDDVRLHINYSTEESSERVFCAHNNLHAEIVQKAVDLTRKHKYKQTVNQSTSNNEVHVQRKKAIIENVIRKQYEQKMYGTDFFKLKSVIENVKVSVLELLRDNSLQTEQKTTEIKVARQVSYYNQMLTHKTTPVSDGSLNKEQCNKVKSMSATELVKLISDNPSNLHVWRELSKIRLNYTQLQELWDIFDKISLDENLKQHIKIVFCNKYQLAVLEYLAQNLENPCNTSTANDYLRPNEYLLKHFDNILTVSMQQESIDLEEYFLRDSSEKRQEVVNLLSDMLKSATTNRKVINDTLLIFLNGLSNDTAMMKKLDEVKEFEKSKEKNYTVKLMAFKSALIRSKTKNGLYNTLIKSIVTPTNQNKILFEDEIQQDKFLYSLYESYVKSTKNTFNWETFSKSGNTEIIKFLLNTLLESGPFCVFYREFLANHFETNILLYTKNENNEFTLSCNHNPTARRAVYFLLMENKFVQLRINKELVEMVISQNTQGAFLNSILTHLDSFIEKNQFDEFISKKPFLSGFYNCVKKSDKVHVRLIHFMMEENSIMGILNAYNLAEDTEAIRCRLEKLKLEYTGCESILYYMALHFDNEGAHISAEELCFFINIILKCALKMPHTIPLICWTVAAYPQEQWLVEVVLLKFEVKINQVVKSKWRQYLCGITDRHMLMLIVKKITDNTNISMEKFQETLYLLSSIPQGYMGLEHLDLGDWKYFLKDKFWSYQLKPIADWSEDQLKSASYHLVNLENVVGTDLCKNLINIFKEHKFDLAHESTRHEITNILGILQNRDVCLNDDLLQHLKSIKISDWKSKVKKTYFSCSEDRTLTKTLEIIKNNNSASDNILKIMNIITETIELSDKIKNMLTKLEDSKFREWISNVLLKTNDGTKSLLDQIKEYIEIPITDETFFTLGQSILHLFSESIIPKSLMLEKSNDVGMQANVIQEKTVSVLFAAVIAAVEREYGFEIRATQKLAIMTLLKSNKNVLSQVATGEGKSIIIVIVALIKALNGQKVDIITSSNVLAKRDANKYRKVYNLFGIQVDHNCSENIEKRKSVYSNNSIVYGELANFQRDYLLDHFYNKNILGDRSFETIIVDEVDSMLLDKGNNTLYLSHEIPGLDKLEQVFIYIWVSLNISTGKSNVKFSVSELEKKVLNEIFGLVTKNDLKSLDSELDSNQVDQIFNLLVKKGIISSNGKVLVKDCSLESFPETSLNKNHLRYLFKKILERKKQITIPNYLNQFVETHLEEWIKSGIRAMLMEASVDYVVDVDRSETSCDVNPNITIIDRDTGTDLVNTQWEDGLHQFLQLKHGCRLSTISLKAVFISNVSYLKKYKQLFGLTGTIGYIKEQNLLEKIYNVDCITIPTSKTKIFLEEESILCASTDEWTTAIRESVFNKIKENRSVLIICETVKDIIIIKQKLNEVLPACKIYTYKRDYEKLEVAEELKPGLVIISTNLAGRGTDIELTQGLINAGGLHVCLSFLPSNSRVEEQAYGRAARKGEPGSAQIIFKASIKKAMSNMKVIDLKKERDADEIRRIADLKNYYSFHVEPQEKRLKEFHALYGQIGSLKLEKNIKQILLQVSLDKWAFWLEKNKCDPDLKSSTSLMEQISKLCHSEYAEHIEDPSQLSKLGLIFVENNKFDQAIILFDRVIKDEPSFSENARYYRICAKMFIEDLTSEHIVAELNLVTTLLKKRIQSLLLSANVIDHLKKVDYLNILQVESFKEQQINICKMYEVFLEYIYCITGHGFDAEQLVLPPIIDEECASRIYNDLLKQNIITGVQIKTNISSDDLKFVAMYGLIPDELMLVLNGFKGVVLDDQKLLKELKKYCYRYVPSRELFWKELRRKQILTNEEKYCIVDIQKLKNIDPSLSIVIDSLKITNKLEDANQIWLYQLEEINCFDEKYFVLTKKESLEREIGRHKYKVLKDKFVIHKNKQATILRLQDSIKLDCFDCLRKEDFDRLDISPDIAVDIIKELENKHIIHEIDEDSYFLVINPRDIASIKISRFKAYSDDIVNLLSYRFAFRLALQKTWELTNHPMTNNDPICLPLQIRVEKLILQDLYGYEIVQKSVIKPNQEKKIRNTLTSLYSRDMTEEQLDSIFSDLFEFSSTRNNIISCLIESTWLIDSGNIFCIPKKYTFKQEDLKQLPSTVEKYSETIQLVLKRHISLSDSNCRLHIEKFIYQHASSIHGIETPSFSLVLLSDKIKQHKVPLREYTIFSLNGFDKLVVLDELKFSRKMIASTFVVALLGVTEISVGTIFGTPHLIEAGVEDLNHVVSCIISGHFSWKEYSKNKIYSVIQAAGRSLFLTGTFNCLYGQKLSLSSVLSSVSRTAMKTAATEIVKHSISTCTIGASHTAIDNLIGPKLDELGTTLINRSTSDIDSIVDNHPVIECIKRLYLQVGKEKATKLINLNSSKVMEDYKAQNNRDLLLLFNKLHIHIVNSFNSIRNQINMKKLSFVELFNLINQVQQIIQITMDLIAFSGYLREIQLLTTANEMTDSLHHSLEQNFKCLKAVKPVPKDCDTEAFSDEIITNWKLAIKEVYRHNINKWIIDPLMNCLKNMFIASLSYKKNAKFVLNHKDRELSERKISEQFEFCEGLNHSKSGKSEESNIFLSMDYDDFLTGLFIKTQSSSVFIEILRNSVTADISFVKQCCSVIPLALKTEGLNIPMLQVLIENGSIQQISGGIVTPESDILTLTITPDENFLMNLKRNKIVLETLFDALYKSILHLQPKSSGQHLRNLVAKAIEKDHSILNDVDGDHFIEPLGADFNYNNEQKNLVTLGKSVYLRHSRRKEVVCCDINREKEFQQLNNIKECVIEAFNTALDKINNHLYSNHPYFKYFKLTLEEFTKTKYEIIPSKQFSLCYFDCYATQYKLVVPLKNQTSNLLVDYNISMCLINCPDRTEFHRPSSPHIVYKIYPDDVGSNVHFVKESFEGIVLLDFDYGDTIYSVEDCRCAGELMLSNV